MDKKNETLLEILKTECVVATGCTEPIAVAYGASLAAKELNGEKIVKVDVVVDGGLFKNGAAVGIPGIKERGLPIATALGIVIGDPTRELRLLENISDEQLESAKQLLSKGFIKVSVNDQYTKLYIEVNLYTEENHIRVLILNRHQNVVSIEKKPHLDPLNIKDKDVSSEKKSIREFTLSEILNFIDNVSMEDILFLQQGIHMGIAISNIGLEMKDSYGSAMKDIIHKGYFEDNLVTRAQLISGAASEARMAGATNPVMTSAGSGNHGLTVFLTNVAVAQKLNSGEELLLRAIALSNLITVYIKSYTGTLSAMCGCGVAAGVGASAGVAYQLGGDEDIVHKTIINMIGSISGLICDGGKEGCAYKVALSSGWAVQSALIAKHGGSINAKNGILAEALQEMFSNLGNVCSVGMAGANSSIIEIIRKNEMC